MTADEQAADGESELDLLRGQNAQLEANLRAARDDADRRIVHLELKAEALRAGMVDLDGLKLLADGEVTVDEQGNVHGAASAMARMRREKPWLFAAQNSSSTAGVPAHGGTRPKLATDMTLDEWRAARADLLRGR
jgi:hypothetical protein